MSVVIKLPTGYFPDPDQGRPVALGSVYIGNVNTDPTVLGNRKSVALLQEDKTEVTIAPASQPLSLNAGGVFTYSGSVVQVKVSGNYSMTVLDSDGVQQYYFPNSSSLSSGSLGSLSYTNGAANSLAAATTGAVTGDVISTVHYDSNMVVFSGGSFQATGTTTIGKAGNCPDADGYFYDAAGKQFTVDGNSASLRLFGALCDDSTDDSAALIAAMASPIGEILIDGPSIIGAAITGASGKTLKGLGAGVSQLNTGAYAWTFTQKDNVTVTGIHFTGLGNVNMLTFAACDNVKVFGNKFTQTAVAGNVSVIRVSDDAALSAGVHSQNVHINFNIFTPSSKAVLVQGASSDWLEDIHVDDNLIIGTNVDPEQSSGVIKIDYFTRKFSANNNTILGGGNIDVAFGLEENIYDGVIDGNFIKDCGAGTRIYEGQQSLGVYNLQFINNTIRDSSDLGGTSVGGGRAIIISGDGLLKSNDLRIQGNTIDTCVKAVETTNGNYTNLIVSDNTISNVSGQGLDLRGGLISGNIIRNCTGISIFNEANGSNGATSIVDNQIFNGGSASIQVQTTPNVLIDGNVIVNTNTVTSDISVSSSSNYPTITNNKIQSTGSTNKIFLGNSISDARVSGNDQKVSFGGSNERVVVDGFIGKSKNWNPGNIPDGGTESTTLTVTGASLGDTVIASFALNLSGMVLTPEVTAADTVTFTLRNETGGAVNLAQALLRAKVRPTDL